MRDRCTEDESREDESWAIFRTTAIECYVATKDYRSWTRAEGQTTGTNNRPKRRLRSTKMTQMTIDAYLY
jgi:hypothetical protein